MAFGFRHLDPITDIQSNGGFLFPVERITARGSKLYRIGLDQLITNVFGMEVSGSNADITSGKVLRIDTSIDTYSTGTAYTFLPTVPASSTVTLGIASTVFDFPGTVEATTVTIDNAGAGANPTLTSNDAGQIAILTGSLTVTGDLLISGNTVTNNVATYAVEDNNILLGDGQAVNSETGAGIDIEANAVVTAYIRVQELGPVNTDDAWEFKVPDNANPLRLGFNLLTATRTLTLPDLSGTIAVLAAAATFTNLSLTDNTNQIVFDSDGVRTTTISVPLPAVASRTYTVPDFGADDSFVGLAATQTLLNKSLTAPAITGGSAIELATLSIRDSAAAFDVRLLSTSTGILADRTLTFNIQNADKTLTLSGSATVNQDVSTAGSPTFVALSVSGDDIIMDSDDAGGFTTTLRQSATAARVVTVPDFTGTLYISGGTDVIVADGGTGVSTLADGGLVIGNAAGAVEVVAAGLTTQILVGGGALTAPIWGTDIPTAVTIGTAYIHRVGGTDVALADGGTAASLAAVNGGIVYSGAAAMAISAAGTANQVLVSGGAGAPTWSAITMDGSVANVIDVRNGTGLLNVAAATSLDINANFTVNSATTMAAYATTICNTANEAAFKAAANLESGIDVQAFDATLLSIAALGTGANKALYTTALDTWAEFDITASGRALANVTIAANEIAYGTGAGTWTTASLTAAARSILDDATTSAINTTLGLGTGDIPIFSGVTLSGAIDSDVAGSVFRFTRTDNAVSVEVGAFEGTKGAGGALDNDEIFLSFFMKDDAAAQTAIARQYAVFTDVNVGTGTDSEISWAVITAGALAKELNLSGTALYPTTDDGLILGSATNRWSDAFFALGAILNFDNGDVTITHAANSLTVAGGTFNATGGGALTGTWSDLGSVTTVDINGGTIDGSVIGGAVAAAITGTAITATSFVIGANTLTTSEWAFLDGQNQAVATTSSPTFANLTITSFAANWTNAGRTVADAGILTTVDINGGSIDGATIGAAATSSIVGTTIDATTDFTVGSLVITSNVLTATGRLTTAMTTPIVGTGFDGAQTALWAIKGRVGAAGPVISEFIVDLTNLINSTTANDIIGESAAVANCHFGQITAAIQGTIQAIEVVCLETPAGGDPDIDIYSAVESTGAENALVTDLTETLLLARGASWANGDVRGATVMPAANEYLYLAVGSAGGAPGTYTAGKFKITIYGTV